MRIKITFEHKKGEILPWDYQYALQQWIYSTLSKSDEDLATQLHDEGYVVDGKAYKLFAFSPWMGVGYKLLGSAGIQLLSSQSNITVSFLLPEVLSTFVSGLFMDQAHRFYFKNNKVIPTIVTGVEIAKSPHFVDGKMAYSLKSGAKISIKHEQFAHPQYIGPDHAEYKNRFLQNLKNKYSASIISTKYSDLSVPLELNILSSYKTQKINVMKDGYFIEMKGYKFDFELEAPSVLHKTLFYAGVGEECSMGMGWVEVLEKEE